MNSKSQAKIEYWADILERNIYGVGYSSAKERLSAYICSMALRRNFGETNESFLEREGLTEFDAWVMSKLKGSQS